MQAIYHGKPVVAMPFFGDQPNNADKMVAKVGFPRHCMKTLHLAPSRACCLLGFKVRPRTELILTMQQWFFMQYTALF